MHGTFPRGLALPCLGLSQHTPILTYFSSHVTSESRWDVMRKAACGATHNNEQVISKLFWKSASFETSIPRARCVRSHLPSQQTHTAMRLFRTQGRHVNSTSRASICYGQRRSLSVVNCSD